MSKRDELLAAIDNYANLYFTTGIVHARGQEAGRSRWDDKRRELATMVEALQHDAYAEGRKDEAEEHTTPMLESLRHVQTTIASNLAFDMDDAPETGWDAVAAFLIRDIDTAISAAYPSGVKPGGA